MGRRTVEEEAKIKQALLAYLDEHGDDEPYRTIARKIQDRIGIRPSTATVGNVIREWRKR